MTSPSICQSHDSSVCHPQCDSTWKSVSMSVCPLSVLSVQPSAKFMVKRPMSITGQNFPNVKNLGKILSIHTSLESSVNPSGSPSVTLSPSAENLLKFPSNHGEQNAGNYMDEIRVKIPTVCTSSVASVIAPIHALTVPSIHPSIHPSDDECQEIPDKFPITNYGETILSNIVAKIPMT